MSKHIPRSYDVKEGTIALECRHRCAGKNVLFISMNDSREIYCKYKKQRGAFFEGTTRDIAILFELTEINNF